ncbi:MAG TPA: hypothetical protein VLU47_08745 [Blastocatellia bacterium]|nr:hypothetical protein [Blastocatellia bacterium]
MQTAASKSLVLTDISSLKGSADLQTATSHGGFYQLIASELVRTVRAEQFLAALGDKFGVMAEHAHAFRQMDALEQVSQFLVSGVLPRQYQWVGRYYQAVCIQRIGHGDVEGAVGLLERVAANAPPRYRARAMISLAANLRHRCDNQSALSLYGEAARFASRNNISDAYATLGTHKMAAVIKSENENHRGALSHLEDLFPLAQIMRRAQPHLYYDYMNSLAVELCEVGRLEEAKNVSRIVLASPFAHAYPEWRETREEIELRGYRGSHATVAVSQRTSEAGNLVSLPLPEPEEGATRQEHIPGQTSQPARVFDLLEWKKKMGKEPNGTPQDKSSYKEMDGREMLLKIMELTASSDRTDDELERILEAIERVLSEPKETGRQ